MRAWRFARRRGARAATSRRRPVPGAGPAPGSWRSSLDRARLRRRLSACPGAHPGRRRLPGEPLPGAEAPLPVDEAARAATAPSARVAGARCRQPGAVRRWRARACRSGSIRCGWSRASPELFLRVEGGLVTSGPIKGTAATADGLTDKDRAENVMITDLVRNDLQRVSVPGTVEVTDLLGVERHPGLVHLVSTVQGRLAPRSRTTPACGRGCSTRPIRRLGLGRAEVVRAARSSRELEPVPRGPYCGAVGWVEVDDGRSPAAELAVGDPDVLVERRRDVAAVRHRRRHHVGERPAGRVGETELKAAPARRAWPRRGSAGRWTG